MKAKGHDKMTEGDGRRRPPGLALLGLAALLILVLAIAGCGSSGNDSTGSSEPATTAEESGGEGEGNEAEEGEGEGEGATAALDKTYAPGVASLNELYEGTEEEPPTSGPKAKKGVSVIWVSCGNEAPGCRLANEYFGEAAKVLGWNYKVIDGKLNVNNGYANAIHAAIASNPDVMITHGMNCPEVKQPLEEAKEAGIVLVEVEEVDCDSPQVGGEKLYDVNMWYSKTAKNTEEWYERYGEMQTQYLVDATQGNAQTIATTYNGLFGKTQLAAWERIYEKCPECEFVSKIPFEASEQAPGGPLAEKFSTALVQYPEANSALFAFDTAVNVTGLSKAIVDAGRNDMTVAGGETSEEALPYLESEEGLTAEPASFSHVWLAWGVADEINRYLSGQPIVPEGMGFKLVTANPPMNLPEKGKEYETEVPFEEAYEKIWLGK